MQTDGKGFDHDVRAAYVEHASLIRRRLAAYGVPAADIDDLCHDVFLVALRKLPSATPAQARAWLDEVAWRVAVAHHRRRGTRREVLVSAAPEPTAPLEADSEPWPTHRQERALVRAAIEKLEPRARELLAFHVIAELPLVEIAKLAQCDPKTARSRLRSAKNRVRGWLRTFESARGLPVPPATEDEAAARDVSPVPSAPEEPQTRSGSLLVTHNDAAIGIGTVDNVLAVVWRSRVTPAQLDAVESCARRLRATRRERLGYLAVVEPGWQPPDPRTRERTVEILRAFRGDAFAYATVLQPGASPLAQPIVNALAFLVGPGPSKGFFGDAEAGAEWMQERALAARGEAPEAAPLASAVRELRRLSG